MQDLPAQKIRALRQLAAAQGNDAAARQRVERDVAEELRADDRVAERHRRAQQLAGVRAPSDAASAHVEDDELHCEKRRSHRLDRKFCVGF